MSSSLRHFLYAFVTLTIILLVINLFIIPHLPNVFHLKSGLLLLTIVSLVVFVSHLILLRASQAKPNVFIRAFIGTMAVKLFIYVLLVAIFLVLKYDEPRAVIIHFLVYYICYTVLETALLLQNKPGR